MLADTPAMNLAQTVFVLALKRVTGWNVDPATLVQAWEGTTAGSVLDAHQEGVLQLVQRATRHTWMTLEIALAGAANWKPIANSLPPAKASVFPQQMEALLDLLTLSGLPIDDSGFRRRCLEVVRSARRATSEDQAESVASCVEPHAAPTKDANSPLERLLDLKLPWGEPVFLGMVGFFVSRGLQSESELAHGLCVSGQENSDGSWRCLELIGGQLCRSEAEIEALLDRPSNALAAASGLERDKEAIERLFQLGLSRYHNGEYPQAAAHFTAALKLDPADARLYAHRGEAHRLQCEYERAIADFHAALRLNPSAPTVLVSRAMTYHLSGEAERAVADCTAALALSPNLATAFRTRAAAHSDLGSGELALADFTEAIALAPEDDAARFQRGILHAGTKQYAEAIGDYDWVLKRNSHHVPAYLHRAHAHRWRGNYGRALRDYAEVLRHHPENAAAFRYRGLTYQLMGDAERAIADYTEAINLESGSTRVYCSRGVLYRVKGDLRRARADLEEALRRQPEKPAALYHRGKILLALGEFQEALWDLTKAISHDPKLVVAYLSRAVLHDRLGQYKEGIADGTRAVELEDTSAAAYLVRGVLYSHMGEYKAALSDLTEAMRLDKPLALAYHERSMAYTLEGDYERALADCNQLLALEPRNAQGYANRSIIHHLKGDIQQALLDYSRALEIDPKFVMTGWNQSLGEAARAQATQRLADFIDGLRREPPLTAEAPPPKFRILLQPYHGNGPSPPFAESGEWPKQPDLPESSKCNGKAEAPQPTDEIQALPTQQMTVPPLPTEAAPKERRRKSELTPKKKTKVLGPGPQPVQYAAAEPAHRSPAMAEAQLAEAPVFDEVEVLQDLLAAPESSTTPEVGDLDTMDFVVDSGQVGPTPPKPIQIRFDCPICRKATVPCEALSGGRVRCSACRHTFIPSSNAPKATPPAAAPRPIPSGRSTPAAPSVPRPMRLPPKASPKKRAYDDDEEGIVARWLKPGRIVAVLVVGAAIYFAWHFSASSRPSLHAARGEVFFYDKPIPGASVVFEPTWTKESTFPRPHGIVKEDGSFVLETFGKQDGAPAGAYKVAVTWFVQQEGMDFEGAPAPKNYLPTRYSRFDTSGLTATIAVGDNQLPAFKLTR
jgi:tetratricopeptide (TPR) repeat protein